MEQKLMERLSRHLLFAGLTGEEVARMAPCMRLSVREYADGGPICADGETAPGPGLVLDGALHVVTGGACGEQGRPDCIGPDGVFGEVEAFSSRGVPGRALVADRNTRVVFLSEDFFLRVCSDNCDLNRAHREVVRNMLRHISERAAFLNRQIAYLTAPDLKTRIAMYLYELYLSAGAEAFQMPLNRDRLAAFFAVARPSLSRELMHLRKQGVIDYHRSSMRILKPDALRGIAEGDSESRA